MSNLASRFLGAGFEDEATKLLEDAMAMEDPNPRVGVVWNRLAEQKTAESEKQESLVSDARDQQVFLRRFGDAYFKFDDPELVITGVWVSNEGDRLAVERGDDDIACNLSTGTREVVLRGRLRNRGALLSVFEPAAREGPPKEAGNAFAYVEDGERLRLMTQKELQHKTYTFTREK